MSKRNITLRLAFIYFYYLKKKIIPSECTYDRHNRTSLVGYSYDRMKKKNSKFKNDTYWESIFLPMIRESYVL